MSDFPNPFLFNQHGTSIYLSKVKNLYNRIPLVLKKTRGVYLYDIDGYKYTDFNLQNGEISFSYAPKCLTKIYKNALSTGFSHSYCYNKFLLKAYRYWEEFTQHKVLFFSYPINGILSVLKSLGKENRIHISYSSDYLYQMLQPLRSFIDMSFCDESVCSDLLIYEPIDNNGSMFNVDRYHARKKLAVYTRFFFRQELTFNSKHPILLSHFLAGQPMTVLIGDEDNSYDHYGLSIYETILFMEGVKYLKKQMKKEKPIVTHNFLKSFQGFAIAKKALDFQFFCKRGIVVQDSIIFFSPYHSAHDLRRLYRALDEYVIHISSDSLDQK